MRCRRSAAARPRTCARSSVPEPASFCHRRGTSTLPHRVCGHRRRRTRRFVRRDVGGNDAAAIHAFAAGRRTRRPHQGREARRANELCLQLSVRRHAVLSAGSRPAGRREGRPDARRWRCLRLDRWRRAHTFDRCLFRDLRTQARLPDARSQLHSFSVRPLADLRWRHDSLLRRSQRVRSFRGRTRCQRACTAAVGGDTARLRRRPRRTRGTRHGRRRAVRRFLQQVRFQAGARVRTGRAPRRRPGRQRSCASWRSIAGRPSAADGSPAFAGITRPPSSRNRVALRPARAKRGRMETVQGRTHRPARHACTRRARCRRWCSDRRRKTARAPDVFP